MSPGDRTTMATQAPPSFREKLRNRKKRRIQNMIFGHLPHDESTLNEIVSALAFRKDEEISSLDIYFTPILF